MSSHQSNRHMNAPCVQHQAHRTCPWTLPLTDDSVRIQPQCRFNSCCLADLRVQLQAQKPGQAPMHSTHNIIWPVNIRVVTPCICLRTTSTQTALATPSPLKSQHHLAYCHSCCSYWQMLAYNINRKCLANPQHIAVHRRHPNYSFFCCSARHHPAATILVVFPHKCLHTTSPASGWPTRNALYCQISVNLHSLLFILADVCV